MEVAQALLETEDDSPLKGLLQQVSQSFTKTCRLAAVGLSAASLQQVANDDRFKDTLTGIINALGDDADFVAWSGEVLKKAKARAEVIDLD